MFPVSESYIAVLLVCLHVPRPAWAHMLIEPAQTSHCLHYEASKPASFVSGREPVRLAITPQSPGLRVVTFWANHRRRHWVRSDPQHRQTPYNPPSRPADSSSVFSRSELEDKERRCECAHGRLLFRRAAPTCYVDNWTR